MKMPPKAQKLLTGKTVVFTETLSMPRNVAALMAQRSGATVVLTVTGACNVIVAAPGAGSKLDKAASKGVEVWTEAEFLHDERLASNNARVIEDTGNSKFQFSLSWDAVASTATACTSINFFQGRLCVADLGWDRG